MEWPRCECVISTVHIIGSHRYYVLQWLANSAVVRRSSLAVIVTHLATPLTLVCWKEIEQKSQPPSLLLRCPLARILILLDALTHSLTNSLTHTPTHRPTHPFIHSPTHTLTHSLTHPPTHSLTHSPTLQGFLSWKWIKHSHDKNPCSQTGNQVCGSFSWDSGNPVLG